MIKESKELISKITKILDTKTELILGIIDELLIKKKELQKSIINDTDHKDLTKLTSKTKSESPASTILTRRIICRTMTSMCLSLILTPCNR